MFVDILTTEIIHVWASDAIIISVNLHHCPHCLHCHHHLYQEFYTVSFWSFYFMYADPHSSGIIANPLPEPTLSYPFIGSSLLFIHTSFAFHLWFIFSLILHLPRRQLCNPQEGDLFVDSISIYLPSSPGLCPAIIFYNCYYAELPELPMHHYLGCSNVFVLLLLSIHRCYVILEFDAIRATCGLCLL